MKINLHLTKIQKLVVCIFKTASMVKWYTRMHVTPEVLGWNLEETNDWFGCL